LPDRSTVVSSFTIIKGALIEETYQIFAAWQHALSKRENLDRVRRGEVLGGSETWLRDVAKVLNRRFDPASRDRALITLAKGACPLTVWKPVLLWHITRDEFLVRHFLIHFLYPLRASGALRVAPQEVVAYLSTIGDLGGVTEHAWTDRTRERVAAGLLKLAADFDLLAGTIHREFASYHLPDDALLYVLHAIHEREQNGRKVIASDEWKMFMIDASNVERELLRLHQFRRVEIHVAGSLAQIELPASTAGEFAERMVA
jgi:hypothetical protein